jgi:uncharacterized protein
VGRDRSYDGNRDRDTPRASWRQLQGWSAAFHLARIAGFAPKAMVFNVMTTKIALGAVVTRAPAVTGLDQDPLTVIETGDWVKVDGDRGIVEVTKKTAL